MLWLPALNVGTHCAVGLTFGLGAALLFTTALAALAVLGLLLASARRHGVGALEVSVAMIGNAGITATVVLLVFAAVIAINCADCNGLS